MSRASWSWTSLLLWGALALTGAWAGGAARAAEEPAAPPAKIEDELARLNRTVKELVALLRQQTAGQRVELLMRQVELKRARLAPVEADLRMAHNAREDAEEQLRQLQVNREQVADGFGMEGPGAETNPERREEIEKMIDQMNRHYALESKVAKERIASLEQKIQTLESEASSARVEVEHWEAVVDRELAAQ